MCFYFAFDKLSLSSKIRLATLALKRREGKVGTTIESRAQLNLGEKGTMFVHG